MALLEDSNKFCGFDAINDRHDYVHQDCLQLVMILLIKLNHISPIRYYRHMTFYT